MTMSGIDIEELIKILPQLIRENDAIKGAIISALSGIVATKDDIKDLIAEMDRRFEAMQKQMDSRFEAIQKQMDSRFDAVDRRFEAMQKQMDARFDAVDRRFEAMQNRMDDRFETLEILIKSYHQKGGIKLEKAILRLLRHALTLENIDPRRIYKKRIIDQTGEIIHKGYKSDIDVVLENGNLYVLEIKATAKDESVLQLLQNAKLYEHLTQKTATQRILICLQIDEDVKELAESNGIKVIYGSLMPAETDSEDDSDLYG
jgi:hypothetical protein